jgi:hypothetical protein
MHAAQSSTSRRVRSFNARPLTMSAIAIGDRKSSAGPKHACRFGKNPVLDGGEVDHSVGDDDAEGGVLEGEIVDARFEELGLGGDHLHLGGDPHGSTRMTLRNRGEPAGLSKIAAPIMATAMRRANRKDLQRIKKILESRPTG